MSVYIEGYEGGSPVDSESRATARPRAAAVGLPGDAQRAGRIFATVSLRVTLSLNISPRARWVVCPMGRTRGHGRRVIYPRRLREYGKEDLM